MSTARAKIENLTHSWYGFAAASAAVKLLFEGLSIWNIVTSGIGFLFTIGFMFFLSRRLLSKGGLTRWLLIGASGLFGIMGAWGAVKASMMFVSAWELRFIIAAASSALTSYMMAKSFRVLTDASVKSYFA